MSAEITLPSYNISTTQPIIRQSQPVESQNQTKIIEAASAALNTQQAVQKTDRNALPKRKSTKRFFTFSALRKSDDQIDPDLENLKEPTPPKHEKANKSIKQFFYNIFKKTLRRGYASTAIDAEDSQKTPGTRQVDSTPANAKDDLIDAGSN